MINYFIKNHLSEFIYIFLSNHILFQTLFYFICSNHLIYETIVRLDTRIKHHIINMISKELTEISTNKIHTNTNYLRSLYEQKQQTQIIQDNYSLIGKVNISNPLRSTNKDPVIPDTNNKINNNETTSELIDETKIELYI